MIISRPTAPSITVTKAKLNKVGYMELEYISKVAVPTEDRVNPEVLTTSHVVTCEWFPHDELLMQFDNLRRYLVELCDQKISTPVLFDLFEDSNTERVNTVLSDYGVSGFTIGGKDEHEGVTLIGFKRLANNRKLNLISPFTKWEDEHNGYRHSYELKIQIQKCQEEIEEYLLNYKRRPNPQLELELES